MTARREDFESHRAVYWFNLDEDTTRRLSALVSPPSTQTSGALTQAINMGETHYERRYPKNWEGLPRASVETLAARVVALGFRGPLFYAPGVLHELVRFAREGASQVDTRHPES
ncbi:hypothetical protein BON30_18775 [Cystobacter ferrugineus]|uniref:Uncharacterized protein n=1 Tax=Cystobacter ferrugineus TaxID=83449 RepID=A0A1L9BBA0_9BACT|nr:hypothetical protein BON30_18775 [Cystobacter ferrugineus]